MGHWSIEIRDKCAAYLGRPIPSHEQVDVTLTEVIEQATKDRVDAEAYRVMLADTRHVIEFNEVGWIIQHPGQERVLGNLFGCPMTRGVKIEVDEVQLGRFYCKMEGDDLVIEEPAPVPAEDS